MTPATQHRCSLLTPPGAGAIAVIRVVGPRAHAIVESLFQPRTSNRTAHDPSEVEQPGRSAGSAALRYGTLVENGEVLDDVIVSDVRMSHTSTVDICTHGGVRVVERILQALENVGAPWRSAEGIVDAIRPPGNRIEAEVFAALPCTKTERAVRFLLWQMHSLPRLLGTIQVACGSDADLARAHLQELIRGSRAAQRLIDGATVVLVGPPNSGKSTLFNRWIGRTAAVVSDTPGTTRDWVDAPIELEGIPITLIDTAGIRQAGQRIERTAIRRGQSLADDADLRLLLLDGSKPMTPEATNHARNLSAGAGVLTAISKCDLPQSWEVSTLLSKRAPVPISARTGAGLAELTSQIAVALGVTEKMEMTESLFTDRQVTLARQALSDLPDSPQSAQATISNLLTGPIPASFA